MLSLLLLLVVCRRFNSATVIIIPLESIHIHKVLQIILMTKFSEFNTQSQHKKNYFVM